jgi:hypothetical protein
MAVPARLTAGRSVAHIIRSESGESTRRKFRSPTKDTGRVLARARTRVKCSKGTDIGDEK